MQVHSVQRTGIPLPPVVKGRMGPRLPGGLPPRFKSTGVFQMAASTASVDRLRGFHDANKAIAYSCVIMR